MGSHNPYDAIRASAQIHPDRLALADGDRWLTYRQLDQNVSRRSTMLLDAGVRPGQRIGLDITSVSASLEMILAILKIRGSGVVLGPSPRGPDPADLRRAFALDWLIARTDAQPIACGETRSITKSPSQSDDTNHEKIREPEREPSLLFPFSSPNGPSTIISLTPAQVGARLQAIFNFLNHGSRVLGAGFGLLPELTWCLGVLAAGSTLIMPNEINPRHICNVAGVDHLAMSPQWARTMSRGLQPSPVRFPTVKSISLIAPEPEPAMLHKLRNLELPVERFVYEWPETGPIATASTSLLERTPLSVGIVLPGVQVQIVDRHFGLLPFGGTGLIRVKSPGMANCSEPVRGHSGQFFSAGWFYPGQLGRLEENGLLFVSGHEEHMFLAGGQWVNPTLVEQVLMTHPAVAEAVVFQSAPSNGRAPRLVAAVTIESGAVDTLMQFARDKLGLWAPASMVQLADFPPGFDRMAVRRLLAGMFS